MMADTGARKKWITVVVAVGLVLDLALVGYVAYLLWNRGPGAATVPPTPTKELVELWASYEQARVAARAQAQDAQLVSAKTQWQEASEQDLLDGTGSWSFVFYSQANSHTLDVMVNTGKAQVVRETQVWTDSSVLPEGAWKAGPKDALLVFLAYDGRLFLEQHPQAMVDLHLGDNGEGRVVWTIVALDPEDRSLLSVLIDAETMDVLS
jgi:hypothetical protein